MTTPAIVVSLPAAPAQPVLDRLIPTLDRKTNGTFRGIVLIEYKRDGGDPTETVTLRLIGLFPQLAVTLLGRIQAVKLFDAKLNGDELNITLTGTPAQRNNDVELLIRLARRVISVRLPTADIFPLRAPEKLVLVDYRVQNDSFTRKLEYRFSGELNLIGLTVCAAGLSKLGGFIRQALVGCMAQKIDVNTDKGMFRIAVELGPAHRHLSAADLAALDRKVIDAFASQVTHPDAAELEFALAPFPKSY